MRGVLSIIKAKHLGLIAISLWFLSVAPTLAMAAWAVDPLIPGTTTIKKSDITEIMTAINTKCASIPGCVPINWSPEMDDLASSTTLIRAAHINKLRAAVQYLYDLKSLGLIPPSDVVVGAPIRASDIITIRSAVDAVPTLCGNGVLNAGEQCDDGNTNPGDGCSATCTCEYSAWTDDSCGAGSCNASEMRQTRTSLSAQCTNVNQCVASGSCGGGGGPVCSDRPTPNPSCSCVGTETCWGGTWQFSLDTSGTGCTTNSCPGGSGSGCSAPTECVGQINGNCTEIGSACPVADGSPCIVGNGSYSMSSCNCCECLVKDTPSNDAGQCCSLALDCGGGGTCRCT